MADRTIRLGPFTKGVDNVTKETSLFEVGPRGERQENSLRSAVNVDIDSHGLIRRRRGFTERAAATNGHSLWGGAGRLFYVDDGVLYSVTPNDYVKTAIRSGLDKETPLSYAQIHQWLFYSNGAQFGRIDLATLSHTSAWGCPSPTGQPIVASSSSGGLKAGDYLVGVTFENEYGQESGCPYLQSVSVDDGGGISLSSIPQGDAAKIRVYCSTWQGTKNEVHFARSVDMGTTSLVIGSHVPGRLLATLFMEDLPAGHIVRAFNGRLVVAVDNYVLYSDALRFGLYWPDRNFLPELPSSLTMIEPTVGGLFVSADKTYFYPGQDLNAAAIVVASELPAFKGSSLQVPAHTVGLKETPGNVPYWFTEHGACIGTPSGQVIHLHDKQLSIGEYDAAATILRQVDGYSQLVTTMRRQASTGTFQASDYAVAEVRRNGVTIT